jgi:GNAT superfamily N-acetyltransferase
MTNHEMLTIVQNQLSINLNCTVADINGEKDSFVFVEAKENPGRMPYLRGKQHFDIMTMGKSIIVSATPARLKYAKEQLIGKSRDEAFSMPFLCSHSMWYLPDLDNLKHISAPNGFLYETVERNEIPKLYDFEGFSYAIQYDLNQPIKDVLVILARQGDDIAAMAGASELCSKMWGIGVDVLPEYHNNGLAVYLVNALTIEILKRNIVPCYGVSLSNIASQKVAYRAGFMPAWTIGYRVRFEGELRNS